jgi:hypothetical protein
VESETEKYLWVTYLVAAILSRFDTILVSVAELAGSEGQFVRVPKRMLNTQEDTELWLQEIREGFKTALAKGPIVIQ